MRAKDIEAKMSKNQQNERVRIFRSERPDFSSSPQQLAGAITAAAAVLALLLAASLPVRAYGTGFDAAKSHVSGSIVE